LESCTTAAKAIPVKAAKIILGALLEVIMVS
jgi:hypothetical protein